MNKKQLTKNSVKQQKSRFNIRLKSRLKIISIVLLVGLLIAEIFAAQYTRFIYANIQCGHAPVVVRPGSAFAGGNGVGEYFVPSHDGYYFGGYATKYFCSTSEAVRMAKPSIEVKYGNQPPEDVPMYYKIIEGR